MADITIAKVIIHHSNDGGYYAASYGANGEEIARTSETYVRFTDAQAAAYTIAAGAEIEVEE